MALGLVVEMMAADLFHDPGRRSYSAMPEMDALTEEGALQEAALVDVRFDIANSTVGLLFDLRGALQLREGTAAVVIARGVHRLEWINNDERQGPIWHAITGSIPDDRSGRFSLLLGFIRGAKLRIEAEADEFYVGHMHGMDAAPPDFIDDDAETIRAGMPNWEAKFAVGFATFLDPPG